MSGLNLDIQEITLDSDNINSNKEISLDTSSSMDLKEANFGSGIELLMNEKVKNSSRNNSSNNLQHLEWELKAIDVHLDDSNFILNDKEENKEILYKSKESFQNKPTIEIAKATSEMETKGETWDGFKDINSVNLDDVGNKAI